MRDVNLLPQNVIDAEENRNRMRQWIAAASVVLVLSFALVIVLERNISKAKDEVLMYSKGRDKIREMVGRINFLSEEKKNIGIKQAILYEIVDSTPWHQIFAKISNCLNQNTWLEQMDINSGGNEGRTDNGKISSDVIRATGGYFASVNKSGNQKNIKDFKISLYGYAVSNIDLAEFMASLANAGRFKSVNLEFAERTKLNGSEPVKFLIKCEI